MEQRVIHQSFPDPHNHSHRPTVVEYVYSGLEKTLQRYDRLDEELKHVCDLIATLDRHKGTIGEDESLMQVLSRLGVTRRGLSFADVIVSKTWATDIDRIGALSLIREEDKLNESRGEDNYVLKNGQDEMIRRLGANLDIRKGHSVVSVSLDTSSGTTIRVRTSAGQEFVCDYCVCAVPGDAIKRNEIAFHPPLPPLQRRAYDTLDFGNCIKVVVTLKRRVWPSDHNLWFCMDSVVSQVWGDPFVPNRITGWITGTQAVALREWKAQRIVQVFLAQLDEIFSVANGLPATQPLATAEYDEHCICNWRDSVYSHPTPSLNHSLLSHPHMDRRLLFAGEHAATNAELGTIDGALQSGKAAVDAILRQLRRSDSGNGNVSNKL